MTARFLPSLALVLVLAVLAPLSVAADVCEECVSGSAAGCCLPACGACVCCGHVVALADARRFAAPAGGIGQAWQQAAERPTRTAPRPVFHVPKHAS
jgi:hypothetical protein